MPKKWIAGAAAATVVVVVVLLALLWRRQLPGTRVLQETQNVPLPSSNRSGLNQFVGADRPRVSNQPASKTDRTKLWSEILARNVQPIEFYGRIEDQDGQAVSGAKVRFEVERGFGTNQENWEVKGSVDVDQEGRFSITGYTGSILRYYPIKEGYVLATTNTSAIFSQLGAYNDQRYTPDRLNPLVVKMWRRGDPEPLSVINQRYELPASDVPVSIDLLTESVVASGGDLQITIKREKPATPASYQFTWSYKITPLSGEIRRVDQPSLAIIFRAPTEGYTNSLGRQLLAGDKYWSTSDSDYFLMSSRGGKAFSKLSIRVSVGANDNSSHYVSLVGIMNPKSRNWEPSAEDSRPRSGVSPP